MSTLSDPKPIRKGRGGYRPGAGRPQIFGEPLRSVTIQIPESIYMYYKALSLRREMSLSKSIVLSLMGEQ